MIELRALTNADIESHNVGEDPETVRWLSGTRSTHESTRLHFATLAANRVQGRGKRGFGIWLDDDLAGYIDFYPDDEDLPAIGDVNIAYAIHPWARRRGVATTAVRMVCEYITREGIGSRAIIHCDAANAASIGVAKRCGFHRLTPSDPEVPTATSLAHTTYALDLRT